MERIDALRRTPMPTLRTATLGCKVNQYETEYVRQGLHRAGYRDAARGEAADLCIVNTCTVTAEGDLKSRKTIRQLARKNPGAEIVVMGCYATRAPELVAALPGVVEVIAAKSELPDFLARRGLLEQLPGIASFGPRHRAYVKVQDGCTQRCAYCIIPSVRPRRISRPIVDVLREIAALVENGYREIVLTGIHLGHYGVDLGREGGDLARLVEAIVTHDPGPSAASDFRLRLSSLEALEVSEPLVDLLRSYPERICPHLHLSMQSGSDAVLRRMRRRYSRTQFIERCLRIRETLDRPALTTDVIVGFPGETDADFEATLDACREIGFSKIHIFRFSPREGTPAATMDDRVHGSVKQARAERLARLERRLRHDFFGSLVGKTLGVLVEKATSDEGGGLVGSSDRYAAVAFEGPVALVGRLVEAQIERAEAERLLGTMVPAGAARLPVPRG